MLNAYVLVFLARYLDVIRGWHAGNMYNSVQKVLLFAQAALATLVVRCGWPHLRTHCALHDTCPLLAIVLPAACAAVLSEASSHEVRGLRVHGTSMYEELAWRFSNALEALAIVPQLWLLRRRGGCDHLLAHFVLALGTYKLLYMLSWATGDFWEGFEWSCGALQVALFLGFFRMHARAISQARRLDVPVTYHSDVELLMHDRVEARRHRPFVTATGGSAYALELTPERESSS